MIHRTEKSLMHARHGGRFSLPTVVFALAGAAFASTCLMAEPVPAPEKKEPQPPAVDLSPAVLANQQFSADLLKRLNRDDKNVFFSPWSLNVALDMARLGARGPAAAALAKGQRLDDKGPKIDAQLAHLRQTLAADVAKQTDPKAAFKFTQANRLWTSQGMVLDPNYSPRLAQQFGADVTSADFMNKDATANAVNQWVSDKTNKLIPILIDKDFVPDAGVILTNAVYFFGKWDEPFNEHLTGLKPFTLSDGKQVDVQMMRQTEHFDYATLAGKGLDGAQAVRLKYQGPASATLILPAEGKMNELVAALDIGSVQAAMKWSEVRLSLPRIDIKTHFPASQQLQQMGMGPAFSPDADYTGITPMKPTYISEVVHAAALKVNETSTEAAGATAVGLRVGSPMRRVEPVELKFDRPFLIVITHETTGAVLFMGRINDPRQ